MIAAAPLRRTLPLLALAAACQTVKIPPAGSPAAPVAPDPGHAASPPSSSLPTVLRARTAKAIPEGARECLARGTTRAVIRLVSSTPDCSGVGHDRMVFEVLHARGAPTATRSVYSSRPLHAGSADTNRPGTLFVAALRADPQPARTLYCVKLPPTEASVTCAVPVEDLAAGRSLVDSAAP